VVGGELSEFAAVFVGAGEVEGVFADDGLAEVDAAGGGEVEGAKFSVLVRVGVSSWKPWALAQSWARNARPLIALRMGGWASGWMVAGCMVFRR